MKRKYKNTFPLLNDNCNHDNDDYIDNDNDYDYDNDNNDDNSSDNCNHYNDDINKYVYLLNDFSHLGICERKQGISVPEQSRSTRGFK